MISILFWSFLGTYCRVKICLCSSSKVRYYIVISPPHPELSSLILHQSPAVSIMDRSRRTLGMKPETMDVP